MFFQTKGAIQCQMHYYYYFLKTSLFYLFIIFKFLAPLAVWGILVPQPGTEPTPTALEGGVLSTGPLGKSWHYYFKLTNKDKCVADLMMAHH